MALGQARALVQARALGQALVQGQKVKGNTTLANNFPWQAAPVDRSDSSQVLCGATISNKRYNLFGLWDQ